MYIVVTQTAVERIMENTQNQILKELKQTLDLLISVNKAIQKEQYRRLVLVSQPAVKVYEWFYTN